MGDALAQFQGWPYIYGVQRLMLDLVSKLCVWRYVMLAIEIDPLAYIKVWA